MARTTGAPARAGSANPTGDGAGSPRTCVRRPTTTHAVGRPRHVALRDGPTAVSATDALRDRPVHRETVGHVGQPAHHIKYCPVELPADRPGGPAPRADVLSGRFQPSPGEIGGFSRGGSRLTLRAYGCNVFPGTSRRGPLIPVLADARALACAKYGRFVTGVMKSRTAKRPPGVRTSTTPSCRSARQFHRSRGSASALLRGLVPRLDDSNGSSIRSRARDAVACTIVGCDPRNCRGMTRTAAGAVVNRCGRDGCRERSVRSPGRSDGADRSSGASGASHPEGAHPTETINHAWPNAGSW